MSTHISTNWIDMKLALEGMYVTFREDARIKTTTGCIIDNSIGINLDSPLQ